MVPGICFTRQKTSCKIMQAMHFLGDRDMEMKIEIDVDVDRDFIQRATEIQRWK
jgi:hypothetical protein